MKRLILNHLVIAATIVFAAVFASCKKDKEDVHTVKLLKTITVCCIKSDGYYEDIGKYDKYRFEYDEQNRIIKMSEYSYDGSLYCTKTFTYAEDDLVQVLYNYSSGNVETYEYTKSGNIITQKCGVITSIIELDSNGLPIKREKEKDEYGNTFLEIYEYLDGNMTEKTEISILPQWEHTESRTDSYEYDNEKGTLYHCNTPKWCMILHLNDFGVKNNRTTAYEPPRSWSENFYKLDGAGFPTKRTCTHTWGMVGHVKEWIEEYTYIKK